MPQQQEGHITVIERDLREWDEIHAMSLRPLIANSSDAASDAVASDPRAEIFGLTDLPGMGHHMVRCVCRERLQADLTVLSFEVRPSSECTTNLVIHEYGAKCIAIVDVARQQILAGSASKEKLLQFRSLDDGWVELTVTLPRERSFHTYIGTSNGLDLIYEGRAQIQYHLRNQVQFRLTGHRDLRALHPELSPSDPFVIVDVGAAGGLQTHWEELLLSDVGESLDVYLFEPGKVQANSLSVDYAQYDNVKILEDALAGEHCNSEIYLTRFPDCASALMPNMDFLRSFDVRPCFEIVDVESIQFTPLSSLVDGGKVAPPDFIKIDVQGLEYEVLKGCGPYLNSCLGVELEAHFYPVYKNQRLLGDIVALLDGFGLRLRTLTPQHTFDWDLVEVNAIFTRDPERTTKAEDLAKLAVIHRVLHLRKHTYGAELAALFQPRRA
jgi:FkbM family methyltransferase